MKYFVKKIIGDPDWSKIPKADINKYRWLSGYEPYAYAQVALGEDRLYLHMLCCEKNPRATYTVPGSRVCCDSCMEFFFSLNGSDKYLNIEMNANGCYLTAVGSSRYDRVSIDPFCGNSPRSHVSEDFWEVTAEVPFTVLFEMFGENSIQGMRGNFYKCGDDTDIPHYGMWSECICDKPDFHRPEFFSELIPEQTVII